MISALSTVSHRSGVGAALSPGTGIRGRGEWRVFRVLFFLHQARQAQKNLLTPHTSHPALGLIQMILMKFEPLIALGTGANHALLLKLWLQGLFRVIHGWALRSQASRALRRAVIKIQPSLTLLTSKSQYGA